MNFTTQDALRCTRAHSTPCAEPGDHHPRRKADSPYGLGPSWELTSPALVTSLALTRVRLESAGDMTCIYFLEVALQKSQGRTGRTACLTLIPPRERNPVHSSRIRGERDRGKARSRDQRYAMGRKIAPRASGGRLSPRDALEVWILSPIAAMSEPFASSPSSDQIIAPRSPRLLI